MEKHRQTYTPEFKLKAVLESYQQDTTQEAMCHKFGISSSMLHRWRQHFQEHGADIFLDPRGRAISQGDEPGTSPEDLKKIIGQLTVQNEILKKPPGCWQESKSRAGGGTGPSPLRTQRPVCEKPDRACLSPGAWKLVLALETSGQGQTGRGGHRAVARGR
jgi:transposase-like protein